MRSYWVVLLFGLAGGTAVGMYVSSQEHAGLATVPEAENRSAGSQPSIGTPLATGQAPLAEKKTISEEQPVEMPAEAEETQEKPLSLYPEGGLEGATARLCYFSFNNALEYATTKRLVAHLNAHSPIQIEVVEFVQDDANIKKSLLAAMRSGTMCDGIVLSGHHRGKFWGDRSSGSMKAKFLEERSCKVGNAEWFANVKAVWLEGCNTGRRNLFNQKVKDKHKVHGSPLNYIRTHLDFGDMEDSLDDIADVLDKNLNKENLAKEYMRIFPYATVMGWTDQSPGEKAGSHYSFPYFLAQIVRIIDEDPRFLHNPMRGKLTPDSARRYSEALYSVLTRDPYENRDGRPDALTSEDTFIKAWLDHSNYRYPFAFDNPSIAGYRSLVNNDNELLRQSTAMRCVLEQENDEAESLGGTVSYLVRNEALTPIASQLLLAIAQSAPGLRGAIAKSDSLRDYLRHAQSARNFEEHRRSEASALLDLLQPPASDVAVQESTEKLTSAR